MKLKKWIKQMDMIGPYIIIWGQNQSEEEEPLYSGSIMNIPWYLVDYKLSKSKKESKFDDAPIVYFDSLREKYNNRPGFVITVEEPE